MKTLIFTLSLLFCIPSFAQTLPNYVPKDSLKLWMPFDGNSNDISGNANNGVLDTFYTKLTSNRCGKPNSAYSFNGINSLIQINKAFFNIGWAKYTVSLWFNTDSFINPNNNNKNQSMINTNPHNGLELSINWGNKFNRYNMFLGSDPQNAGWDISNNWNRVSSSPVVARKWQHMVFVKNGLNYSLYLNGVLDTTITSSITPVQLFTPIIIGNIVNGNECFWGKLDDYGIWNRALSNAEILALFNASCYPDGIENNEENVSLELFPNPFSETLTIKANIDIFENNFNIVNILGVTVKSGVLKNESTEISVADLSPGTYFLKVGNSKQYTYKLIKH